MKDKLTLTDQIAYMRDTKKIQFDANFSETMAQDFLTNHNYFFKLKSYSKLFEKSQKINEENQYTDLHFSQLVELSRIDLYIRQLIINITLSIEHSLKIELILDISNDPNENGYSIVQKFFNADKYNYKILDNIYYKYKNKSKTNSSHDYTSKIIDKYFPKFPAWAFVEIINFGELINFYSFYYKNTSDKSKIEIINLLFFVKKIRNACAHNNCLLPSLKRKNPNPNRDLLPILKYKFNKDKSGKDFRIFSKSEKSKLQTILIKDLVSTIIVLCEVTSNEGLKIHHMKELKHLFDETIPNSKSFFTQSNIGEKYLIDSYKLLKNIIDIYYMDLKIEKKN